MRIRHLFLLVAAVAAASGCADARTSAGLESPAPSPTATGTATAGELSDQDRIWMKKIHQGNLAEVQAGRLAADKATAAKVKEVGELLVEDHTALDEKLTDAAGKLGVKLPTTASGAQKKAAQALESASRADFDQEFLAAMRKEHSEAIAETQTEIKKGSSSGVKAMAEDALPQLQHHLDMIKEAMKTG
ncbi:DUF4142 domain-containing protein [Nonomuraea sp. SBT364]|uniref:DUF4142 domain-containing protein n=1 Tax=Nonomuraea sp. SBT364 TaxID=1580530 RepID=UPI00066E6981|nr:DUF4142 domain-containing protein [Nonomuraea sp. SBT364]